MKNFPWPQYLPLIGVDEVGRGCLAGPVYAAAVFFEGEPDSKINLYIDSKQIPPEKRQTLAQHIQTHYKTSLGWASAKEIDDLNILQASLLAMKRAVLNLKLSRKKLHILIDGKHPIKDLDGGIQVPLIKGDQRARPIGAASIIAKTARDKHLERLCQKYPQYGFSKHKGYGTKAHKEALIQWGASPEHRKTFKGVPTKALERAF